MYKTKPTMNFKLMMEFNFIFSKKKWF